MKAKHQPCACGCGELADECTTGRNPFGAFTVTVTSWRCEMHGVRTTGDCPRCDDELIAISEEPEFQDPCFWCRRGMHDSCNSGELACRCCGEPA